MALVHGRSKKAFVHEEEAGGYEPCKVHGRSDCEHCYADGGEVGFEDEEKASGYDDMDGMSDHDGDEGHSDMGGPYGEELMGRILKAHGGVVSNKDEPMVDEEPAEYDDMELDDHLEPHMKEEGPGDHEEDEERHEMVSRILKESRKKDRNPRPA